MKFVVRYWSSLLPDHHKPDGEPHWVDYSLHPASKMGLHNALLTLHDRLQVLEQHGGLYECALFVLETDGREEMLSQEAAERLFASLPHGEVKWLDVRNFLLLPLLGESDPTGAPDDSVQQLHLFDHPHVPYEETVLEHHEIETDA
jgi:hypothetical protein